MLMMRIVLATVCCRFGSWGLFIKLNFCSDFEHNVWSNFKVEVQAKFEVEILKLMLGRDSEDEIWSRFVFEFMIWPQDVTLVRWTQSSGPLCLWQCLGLCVGIWIEQCLPGIWNQWLIIDVYHAIRFVLLFFLQFHHPVRWLNQFLYFFSWLKIWNCKVHF